MQNPSPSLSPNHAAPMNESSLALQGLVAGSILSNFVEITSEFTATTGKVAVSSKRMWQKYRSSRLRQFAHGH